VGKPLTALLMPEIHIAILRSSEILPRLAEALCRPELRDAAAGVIVIAPSRIVDIEKTLIISFYGLGELHVFLLDDFRAA